mgnify:CR=1 FL=1
MPLNPNSLTRNQVLTLVLSYPWRWAGLEQRARRLIMRLRIMVLLSFIASICAGTVGISGSAAAAPFTRLQSDVVRSGNDLIQRFMAVTAGHATVPSGTGTAAVAISIGAGIAIVAATVIVGATTGRPTASTIGVTTPGRGSTVIAVMATAGSIARGIVAVSASACASKAKILAISDNNGTALQPAPCAMSQPHTLSVSGRPSMSLAVTGSSGVMPTSPRRAPTWRTCWVECHTVRSSISWRVVPPK